MPLAAAKKCQDDTCLRRVSGAAKGSCTRPSRVLRTKEHGTSSVKSPAHTVGRGDVIGRGLSLDERAYVSLNKREEDRDMADVVMPMNGKVIDVKVAVGDAVQEDAEVVIIEAMKMELPVVAEASGTVKEVKASVGKSYQVGDVLLVIE